jgi:hypothetical protein
MFSGMLCSCVLLYIQAQDCTSLAQSSEVIKSALKMTSDGAFLQRRKKALTMDQEMEQISYYTS